MKRVKLNVGTAGRAKYEEKSFFYKKNHGERERERENVRNIKRRIERKGRRNDEKRCLPCLVGCGREP